MRKEPPQRGARGAESTRRPGCGGRLDRVTGVGSPAHRLVELEVRLGLGERVEQREVQSNPAGSRMSAFGRYGKLSITAITDLASRPASPISNTLILLIYQAFGHKIGHLHLQR